MATLVEKIIECLKENGQITAPQMADWFWDNYRADADKKIVKAIKSAKAKNKTPNVFDEQSCKKQYVAEIHSHWDDDKKRPSLLEAEPRMRMRIMGKERSDRIYYLAEHADSPMDETVAPPRTVPQTKVATPKAKKRVAKKKESKKEFEEKDLYPLLIEYLEDKLSVDAYRIDEKRWKDKPIANENHWLFPDIVGLEKLTSGWSKEIDECARTSGAKRARLWSFEVKTELISRDKVRKSFFQAVGNSAWANFGYLVATKIDDRRGTRKELNMLSTVHGIGVILLNADEPKHSEILIPAREKPEVDWTSANRLYNANKDFDEYIERVRTFLVAGDFQKK